MSAQIICVHTSKGGTGKSTITTILASYLTYELSKRVLVIDADAPQFSIDSLRHREQTIYQNISHKCQDFDEVKKALFASQLSVADQAIYERYRHNQQRSINGFYPIYTVEQSELDELDIEKISDSYDYVFFDLGGRFDESIVRTLHFADLVLVPFTTQNIDVMASLEYCLTLADHVKQGHLSDSTQFYCFWNKYKFTFQKKAELIELQLKTKFAAKGISFDFLETRLNDADSGFDRAKMWTTISSPILFKGGQYLNGIARFTEEVIKLSNYQNS